MLVELFSSTQAPTKTQATSARVCGLPQHRVVCRMKRMGGGFGGKETRGAFTAAVASLGALATNAPVRLSLPRDVDMQVSGCLVGLGVAALRSRARARA